MVCGFWLRCFILVCAYNWIVGLNACIHGGLGVFV